MISRKELNQTKISDFFSKKKIGLFNVNIKM